jgi:hypothetical protein
MAERDERPPAGHTAIPASRSAAIEAGLQAQFERGSIIMHDAPIREPRVGAPPFPHGEPAPAAPRERD